MNEMKKDITQKIKVDFPASATEVIAILESLESMNRGPISDRIYRAIIHLTNGDQERLNQVIELAFKDHRDLLWQAEYKDPEIRKYDFNKTFNELGLL